MKYSYKLSDAIHLLSYLDIYKDGDLSSKAIANSICLLYTSDAADES